jgi:antitoxin component HigA of HigAB toxin-antitoxin module
MTSNFITQYENIKSNYSVPHLINKEKHVLFVLESPHIDELLAQAPVSGKSGKSMTNVLFPFQNDALGIKLKREPDNFIGIVNICSIPMQEIAYNHPNVVSRYNPTKKAIATKSFFEALESIRTNPRLQYLDEEKNELQEAILNDFKEEMMKLEGQELLLIPCGKTATTFLNMSGVSSPNWTILEGIPHPSFNQWKRKTIAMQILDMKLKISDMYWKDKTTQPHEVLKAIIEQQAISVEELSFSIDIDTHIITNIIEGQLQIPSELAEKLSKYFAIPIKYLTIP